MSKEKEMTITKLRYNWHQVEDGEDYHVAEVGRNHIGINLEVVSIEEHTPQLEVDKWYYNITFIDGSVLTVFNPNEVYREKV